MHYISSPDDNFSFLSDRNFISVIITDFKIHIIY